MAYLDRIAECNRHDLSRFAPFSVAAEQVGWVRRDRIDGLVSGDSCLQRTADGVAMDAALVDFDARSRAMAPITEGLMQRGEISAWRGEHYPVKTAYRAPALLQMERAAVTYFGVRAFGVHLNGFVRRGDAILMWIARRARDKPTYPGMLDNMVAGGQPVGISLRDNVVKECGEEAGIPPELAARARPVGAVTYCLENDLGIKPDCMFCYDLELPEEFEPECVDGEAEAFELWPIERVAEAVRDTREFKFNCNLVVIDFLVRHGLLEADADDYLDIVKGLRSWGGE